MRQCGAGLSSPASWPSAERRAPTAEPRHRRRNMCRMPTTPRVSRRGFLGSAGAAAIAAGTPARAAGTRQAAQLKPAGSLTDIGGVRVGHFTDARRPTGCTAILFDQPATAGVDYDGVGARRIARGHAAAGEPARPDSRHPVRRRRADGARRDRRGRPASSRSGRWATTGACPNVRVPIVVGAVIDDLALGDGRIRVGPDEAIRACRAATAGPSARAAWGRAPVRRSARCSSGAACAA